MFIALHNHSEYSVVDSLLTVEDLVQFAVQNHMHSIALTDRNNLFGAVKFYKAARSKGIKPILGCDISIRNEQNDIFQLVLLAKDHEGFKALCRLLSALYLHSEPHGHKALAIAELTPETCRGLIALSGGLEGDVGHAIVRGDWDGARARIRHWQQCFGTDYYLQVTAMGKDEDELYQSACAQLSAELGVPAVASNLACFQHEEDFDTHEIRVCIANGYLLESPNRPRHYTPHYALKNHDALREVHAEVLLDNSEQIALQCNVVLPLGEVHLPPFPTPDGQSQEVYLAECAYQGLEERLQERFPDPQQRLSQAPRYRERLEKEIHVIQSMGFAGYFLIVMDFIQWAKAQNIPVGPGRGSGAGSLAAYVLKITDLDPLPYDLLFERFLNPERVSMPDFDIDFCMDRRDEVIHYVAERYGQHRVSQIATHGTMAAKGVLRDVGRVLGMPYMMVDKISKMVPTILGITLNDALGKGKADMQSPELIAAYQSNEEVQMLVDYGLQLEGLTRSVGKHAGGVLISPTTLTDFTALYQSDDSIISQFDKDDIEAVGLVKFDFLGLRTLTIIDWAMQHINRQRLATGQSALSISTIPLDDVATFALLQNAQTTAVFQLESSGLKELIARLKPNSLEDLIALVALYRPGPLKAGMTDEFVHRKQGVKAVTYQHPALESVLSNTYGVVVYQEQVMQIAQVLANYTLGGADELRRAMGKKKAEEMARHRVIFTEKAVANGIDSQLATTIFDHMETFAEYGFNKSHSATYALIAYQTAWLKAHYPAEFMAAVLSSEIGKPEKIVKFLNETRTMGLQVLPPCINRSTYHFMPCTDGVIYGLGGVKGVGEGVVNYIVHEREQNGAFTSLSDFCQRIDFKRLNKRVLETLITVGAFDSLESNRGGLMHALPTIIATAEKHHKNLKTQQGDMFGLFASGDTEQPQETSFVAAEQAWSLRQTLDEEKKILGLFLSGHPLDNVRASLDALHLDRISEVHECFHEDIVPDALPREKRFGRLKLGGIITSARVMLNKRQQNIGFITLDDGSGQIEIGVFGQVLENDKALCVEDAVVVMEVRADYDTTKQNWRFAAVSIEALSEARAGQAQGLRLHIQPHTPPDYALWLREHLVPTSPEFGVWVQLEVHGAGGEHGLLALPSHYLLEDKLLQQLESYFSPDQVQLFY